MAEELYVLLVDDWKTPFYPGFIYIYDMGGGSSRGVVAALMLKTLKKVIAVTGT